jgi:hypothetical protein
MADFLFRRRVRAAFAGAGAGLVLACGAATATSSQSQPPQQPATTAPWERVVYGAFENRGVAQVETLNGRWTLRVACNGIHVTYLDEDNPAKIDLETYRTAYVRARYRWVERSVRNPRCIKEPCMMKTREIALERLERIEATAADAERAAADCGAKQR